RDRRSALRTRQRRAGQQGRSCGGDGASGAQAGEFFHKSPLTQGISLHQQKSPTRHLGAFGIALSREERGPLRHGRVAWLTAFKPITVAGPRPIHTAFPASLTCKLNFECKPRPRECQRKTGNGTIKFEVSEKTPRRSAILPVGLALFHEGAETFLRILKAVEFIQENVHRMLKALAQGQTHAAENRLLRHCQHGTGVAVDPADEITYCFFELSLRHEAIDHTELQ